MRKIALVFALTFSVAAALDAAPVQGRAAVTPAQIAGAISSAGIQISADQVTLLTDVTAASVFPALTVESMEPWGDHRMKVRISCTARDQCLPFFVVVRLNQQGNAAQGNVEQANGQQGNVQQDSAVAEIPWSQNSPARFDSKAIVVRAGSAATLLIDSGHVHIRIAVVCMENGAAGQTIRVTSKDHRQTYIGKVIEGGALRAGL